MEENKNCKSNDELMDDSMDAVAGGKKKSGWTKKRKEALRNGYCQNFDDPEAKFEEITTNYTYDQFQEKLREAWGGFKY